MNTIQALTIVGDFTPYLQFSIDGEFLDDLLDRKFPEEKLAGLYPTLNYNLINENERNVVWNRIIPENDKSAICPILMCEDDCDFFCIIIVVEIEMNGNTVEWKRFGIDLSEPEPATNAGSKVTWFDGSPSFKFQYGEYQSAISAFKREFDAYRKVVRQ